MSARTDILKPSPRYRWTPERKRRSMRAVARGEVTRGEFMQAHAMSDDEFYELWTKYGPEALVSA